MMFSHRATWESSRWSTFCVLSAMGCKNMHSPSDLTTFPWEEEDTHDREYTDEELEEQRERIRKYNERQSKPQTH